MSWLPLHPRITGLGFLVVGLMVGCVTAPGAARAAVGLAVSVTGPTLVTVNILIEGSVLPGRYAQE